MKAYVRGSAQNQEVKLTEVGISKVQKNEVLIKVHAFGVGIHDRYFIPMDANFPYVIGSEGAGVIEEVDNSVTDFKKGDRVIFSTALQPQGGSWAEYAVARSSTLIQMPAEMSFEEAASLPIAGKTALECMRELDLSKGDKLFISGASGAIGTFVIQLASKKGAVVSASASEKNHSYMKSLGAGKTVDYKASDWKEQIVQWSEGGVDAALAIQPGTGIDGIEVVKDNGELITVSGDSQHMNAVRGIAVRQMGHDMAAHQKMIELVQEIAVGKINVVIEKQYSFDEALDALQKAETRHARGKLVVTV